MEVAAESMGHIELNSGFDLPSPLEPRAAAFSPQCVVGFAIISKDGMLANAAGVMPELLKFEADQRFFENGLDRVDVVVHGRHSHEQQPRSFMRKRLILTRRIRDLEPASSTGREFHWNPNGLSFERALAAIEAPSARIGVVGATDVFGLFLDRYDSFYLTRGPDVLLPGGRAVFPGVPSETPEQVLGRFGLKACDRVTLDPDGQIVVAHWRRGAAVC